MALTILAALAIFILLAFSRASITSWVLATIVIVPVIGATPMSTAVTSGPEGVHDAVPGSQSAVTEPAQTAEAA